MAIQSSNITTNGNSHEYFLPYKVDEDNRLNTQHTLLKKIFGGLYLTPLDTSRPLKVLDIGCGTGAWVFDFAKQHPNCQVYGIDVATYTEWKDAPANCTFAQVDVETPAQWEPLPHDFDFIHSRFLLTAIRDWAGLLESCRTHLKAGGWLEMQELYFPIQCQATDVQISQSQCFRWTTLFLEALRKANVNAASPHAFPFLLKDAGFARVGSEDFRMILGEWPDDEAGRELGRLGHINIANGARGFTGKLFPKMLGMSDEEHEELVIAVLEENRSGKFKSYLPLKVAFGQKQT